MRMYIEILMLSIHQLWPSQQFWSVMTNLFHMTAALWSSDCIRWKLADDSESHILYPKFNINMVVTKIIY